MDRDFLIELFASFGAIDIRSMFGGLSLSADGLTFALAAGDRLYLKADVDSIPRFEAEGCAPFQYEAQGRVRTMASYWQMPDRLFDDPDEAAEWARIALAAARRAALSKPEKTARKKPGVRRPKY